MAGTKTAAKKAGSVAGAAKRVSPARCQRCHAQPPMRSHHWCATCMAAWRRGRRAARYRAEPAEKRWDRVWNTLRMRAYRGHRMAPEPCRGCGSWPAYLMLLVLAPVEWTWLCRPCRERKHPERTCTGYVKVAAQEARARARLAAECQTLGV